MIDRTRFEELAALAAVGEATGAEREELDRAIRENPALNQEFGELCATELLLDQSDSTSSGGAVPALPEQIIAQFESTRREALSRRMAAEAQAHGGPSVVPFTPPKDSPRKRAPWLAMAAMLAVLIGLSAWWLRPRDTSASIAVLAPRGITGATQPRLVWDAKPGQQYDVWILPPEGSHIDAPALFTAKNVRPPIAFSELKPGKGLEETSRPTSRLEPDTDYRLLVCIANAGRVAGIAMPFHTTADAAKALPAPSLAAAQHLAAEGRPSDALTLLGQLPGNERALPEVESLEHDLRSRLLAPKAP